MTRRRRRNNLYDLNSEEFDRILNDLIDRLGLIPHWQPIPKKEPPVDKSVPPYRIVKDVKSGPNPRKVKNGKQEEGHQQG